jgi:serine/threonine protein kinase
MSEWLQKRTAVDPQENLEILHQLLLGLEHIHRKGFIHRDIKPANVFILFNDKRIKVKIGDFGLSKHLTGEDEISMRNTESRADRRKTIAKSLEIETNIDPNESNTLTRVSAKSSPDRHAMHTSGVGTYLYTSPGRSI